MKMLNLKTLTSTLILTTLVSNHIVLASGKDGKIPEDDGKSKFTNRRAPMPVQPRVQQEEDPYHRALQLLWSDKTRNEGERLLRNLAEDTANPRSLEAAIHLLTNGDHDQQALAKIIILNPRHPKYHDLYNRADGLRFSDAGPVLFALIASDSRHPDNYRAAKIVFRSSQSKSEDKRKIAPLLIKVANDLQHPESLLCALIVFMHGNTEERKAVLEVVRKIAKDQSHSELASVVLDVFLTGNAEDKIETRRIIEESMHDITNKEARYYATNLLEKGNQELKSHCLQFFELIIRDIDPATGPIDCVAINLFLRFADTQTISIDLRRHIRDCIKSLCIVKDGEDDRMDKIWSLIHPISIPKEYEDTVVTALRKIVRNEGGNQPDEDRKWAANYLLMMAKKDVEEVGGEYESGNE